MQHRKLPESVFGQAEAVLDIAIPGHEVTEFDAKVMHGLAILMLQMTEAMAMANRAKFDQQHGSDVFDIVPQEVFQRPLMAADVKAYPEYFVNGPGRLRAQHTLCEHKYGLLDSCPNCP